MENAPQVSNPLHSLKHDKVMKHVMKAKDKTTGEIVTVVYAANKKGNLRFHVNGVSITDKAFDKQYKLLGDDVQDRK
jgi:uncharacterized membrane protein